MNLVEPIKDKSKIINIAEVLLERNKRDFFLFIFGINSGLNITEILNLKFGDLNKIKKNNKNIFYEMEITKNGRIKKIIINEAIINAKNIFYNSINRHERLTSINYVFKSRKSKYKNKPINRQQAYRIINNAAEGIVINCRIGTHTLRKTFGYHYYKENGKSKKALMYLKELFNHSAPCVTLRYIGF